MKSNLNFTFLSLSLKSIGMYHLRTSFGYQCEIKQEIDSCGTTEADSSSDRIDSSEELTRSPPAIFKLKRSPPMSTPGPSSEKKTKRYKYAKKSKSLYIKCLLNQHKSNKFKSTFKLSLNKKIDRNGYSNV